MADGGGAGRGQVPTRGVGLGIGSSRRGGSSAVLFLVANRIGFRVGVGIAHDAQLEIIELVVERRGDLAQQGLAVRLQRCVAGRK